MAQCPLCSSTKIKVVSTYYESDPNEMYQDMLCKRCKKEWTEPFTRSRIHEFLAFASIMLVFLILVTVIIWVAYPK